MKPDYALSLSLDGIKLMCRIKEGWHELGQVPLAHVDLDSALDKLRQEGDAHADGKALCKIILPNDQIKYLNLPNTSDEAETAVAKALEEATPYALDDLAYDFIESGDNLQVAAVAKETLDEALSFALEHGFHPVCFVAIPEIGFDAEPFFGLTHNAAELLEDGEAPQPDDAPIGVVSTGPLPVDENENEPTPAFASRRLVASTEGDGSAKPLGGATRGLDTAAAEISDGVAPTEPSENSLAAQEPRFDTATLIAGLKQRPEPSGQPRVRGAARADTPDAEAPEMPESREKIAAPEPAPVEDIKAVQPEPKVGGKPKYLGLTLVIILLAFLASVAVWASIFSEEGAAGLFSPKDPVAIIPLEPEEPEVLETTALPPVSNDTITDTAEIEAMDNQEGILIDPVLEAALPTPTGDALYAATGIWDRAPVQPNSPNSDTIEAVYLASFEPVQQTHDAIALPAFDSFGVDPQVAPQNNPVAAGTLIDLDERGLVIATAEGAISPEGILVYLGKPAVVPNSFPDRVEIEQEIAEEVNEDLLRLAAFRPKARPNDITEQNERATLGGSTLSEIAKIRPKMRPEQTVQLVSIDASAIQEATDQAVLASVRPRSRPSDFASTVQKQQERLASVAVPSTERVAPSIPTTASVARNATQENVINLRKVNLIGVYGASNDRRALVRLASGRYKKVQIGDKIDGGRVAAINSGELHYVKGSRTIVLKMPRG